jgi:FAD:protein FMN transferase
MMPYLYFWVLLSFLLATCTHKNNNDNNPLIRINGKTMGSGYNVSYTDSLNRRFDKEIDSFLIVFNKQLSTYDSNSVISTLNNSERIGFLSSENTYLVDLLTISKDIYIKTKGYFNPAVKPLVNYWGFGYQTKKPISEANPKTIDSLLQLSNFDFISVKTNRSDSVFIIKENRKVQIEFNAVAPGYAADKIAELLIKKGVKYFLVEIGGEVRAGGQSVAGFGWKVGINKPSADAGLSELQAVVELKNISLATSGNYRSFYEQNGKKYVHTINPKTGYTEQNKLLSASVFAATCAEADAYATAFMAMGLEKSTELIPKLTNLKVFLVFADSNEQLSERYLNGAESFFIE